MVQINAIGVIKHLCNGNGEPVELLSIVLHSEDLMPSRLAKNCYDLVLQADGQDAASTGLHQIISLVKRSDSTAVKSEGTRVFVNVIRTLWHENTPDGEKRKAAMGIVSTGPIALTLAQLVGRSKRYPILINEGIVALTLLSLHSGTFIPHAPSYLLFSTLHLLFHSSGRRPRRNNDAITVGGSRQLLRHRRLCGRERDRLTRDSPRARHRHARAPSQRPRRERARGSPRQRLHIARPGRPRGRCRSGACAGARQT